VPILGKRADLVDLDATAAETGGFEAEESRCGDKGSDFLSTNWKEGAKFELVGEMGSLVEDFT
jgi:hypothetical protein